MPIFFVDRDSEGGMEQMRSQMRRNMRSGSYPTGGNTKGNFHEGYREGYRHGWEDKDWEHKMSWEDPEYRRARDSRGRFI